MLSLRRYASFNEAATDQSQERIPRMRLIATTEFTYAGRDLKRGDIFDAPPQDAIDLTNRDLAHRFHLEDPATLVRQENPPEEPAEPLPDVPPVTIAPTTASVPASGGTGSIAVTITGEGTSGTWTVDKDATATWLTYTPTTPQSASGTVNYSATANTAASRVAHFYINGKTFTLDQAAAA
jgi:hypothetical protein